MTTSRDSVNLGNPNHARRDAAEQNDAKVTNADPPRRADNGVDDLFDDTIQRPSADAVSPRNPPESPLSPPASPSIDSTLAIPVPPPIMEVSAVLGTPIIPPVMPAAPLFDTHAQTLRDPEVEMVGEATNHRDPLSGESGTHPVGVGVGAATGGAAVGAATGLVAGAVAGPLGAALGAAAGTVIGAIAGGYAGKGLAEMVNPTTEDHYWRSAYVARPYVAKGATYEEYEPAYTYGIQMRERLIEQTWEEAETVIRVGWEQSAQAVVMDWERARPAIQDAWDHLTPEPVEPGVSQEEKLPDK